MADADRRAFLTSADVPQLEIPPKHHLLITTRSSVYSWSSKGLVKNFSSPGGAILAAKESMDGTGLLAVADNHVVILKSRDVIARPFRIKGADEQTRLLAFANSANALFFSSSLQNAIQCYSVRKDRILEFSCVHPSPPTVMAVSRASSYVVSASKSPPKIYLQDLASPSGKIIITPHASEAFITAAAFHPQRNEIFVLAYADGTLSVHTASRIVLMRKSGSDGGIAHLKAPHRRTSSKSHGDAKPSQASKHKKYSPFRRSGCITSVAFIPGYKLRVVGVAGDGRCRIIDFERGATVLRTWRADDGCTSVAIFPSIVRGKIDSRHPLTQGREGFQPYENYGYNYIIAVGRADGYVVFYDELGLHRTETLIEANRSRIIDLQWISEKAHGNLEASLISSPTEKNDRVEVKWEFAPQPQDGLRLTTENGPASSQYRREKPRTGIRQVASPLPDSLQRASSCLRRASVTSNRRMPCTWVDSVSSSDTNRGNRGQRALGLKFGGSNCQVSNTDRALEPSTSPTKTDTRRSALGGESLTASALGATEAMRRLHSDKELSDHNQMGTETLSDLDAEASSESAKETAPILHLASSGKTAAHLRSLPKVERTVGWENQLPRTSLSRSAEHSASLAHRLLEPCSGESQSRSKPSSECNCVAVFRPEMALLRSEVASLRKGLWVLGSRIDGLNSDFRYPNNASERVV